MHLFKSTAQLCASFQIMQISGAAIFAGYLYFMQMLTDIALLDDKPAA